MSKNIAIVIGILALFIVVFVGYTAIKKLPQTVNKVPVNSKVKPTVVPTPQSAQGTLRGLLSSEKSQKCTYSYDLQSMSVSGTVYVAKGKLKGDFTSISQQAKIGGHMIVVGGYTYIWTDLNKMGVKMAFDQAQPSNASATNSQVAQIDQSFNYSCQGWTEDDSLFTLPSNITFTTTALPVGQPSNSASSAGKVSPSSACSVCDRVPAGSGRDACRAQLHCQ